MIVSQFLCDKFDLKYNLEIQKGKKNKQNASKESNLSVRNYGFKFQYVSGSNSLNVEKLPNEQRFSKNSITGDFDTA